MVFGPEPVKVRGLDQLRRSMRQLDTKLPRMIRVALNKSGEIVKDKTLPWVPRQSGRARGSLKLRSTQTKARVVMGGNRAPYVPWLDFGGRRAGRGGGIAVRRRVQSGRFIWRTFGKHRDEVIEVMDQALIEVVESSGLKVTTDGS